MSPAEIRNSKDFRVVNELKFNDILAFVLVYIRVKNIYTFFYIFSNLILISIITGLSVFGFMESQLNFGNFLSGLSWGVVAGSILIIPFHEGLHALAFLIIGARKVRFGADLKHMIFYATAKDFVAGRKGFFLVALAPYLTINSVTIPFAINDNTQLQLFLLVLLLVHNIMCIGDFAMLSFFRENKEKELYTFDDLDTKTAWFYEKKVLTNPETRI